MITSARELRNLVDGDITLLQGFNFNIDAKLGATIDRATGNATVAIPSFIPLNQVVAPAGATHFKLVSRAAEIDFATGNAVTYSRESAPLQLNGSATSDPNLEYGLPANSALSFFLVLGIQIYQQVNGVQYSLRNGAFNALSIVKVS